MLFRNFLNQAYPKQTPASNCIFNGPENIVCSNIGSCRLVFTSQDNLFPLERIVLSDEIIRFRVFAFSSVIIQFRWTIKNLAQKREVIPSRFCIKIQVGFFMFFEQNKLFQSPQSLQDAIGITDHVGNSAQ